MARSRRRSNLPLQRQAERLAAGHVARLGRERVGQVAAVVLENRTGAVRAYVGSADFFDDAAGGQTDGARALRQPGSTLKPFTYAAAIERLGYGPATVLPDTPDAVAASGGAFVPANYDGRFHGDVPLRRALASSYNVPAVVVAERVGLPELLAFYRAAGFASLRRPAEHYGAAMTLGAGEVTLVELAQAYARLARCAAGQACTGPGGRAAPFSPATAALIADVLADPEARESAFGRGSALELPFPVAVKTGTSKDYRDTWAVGFSPTHTVAVWAGNFSGAPMREVSGVSGAAPLLAALFEQLGPGGAFPPVPGVETRTVCPESGHAHGPACVSARVERFRVDAPPLPACALHAAPAPLAAPPAAAYAPARPVPAARPCRLPQRPAGAARHRRSGGARARAGRHLRARPGAARGLPAADLPRARPARLHRRGVLPGRRPDRPGRRAASVAAPSGHAPPRRARARGQRTVSPEPARILPRARHCRSGTGLFSPRPSASMTRIAPSVLALAAVCGAAPVHAQVERGALGAGDLQRANGTYYDAYPVVLEADQELSVDLASDAFDTFLVIRFPDGRTLENDDFGGTGTSRITLVPREAGTYQVWATSYSKGEGAYELVIARGRTAEVLTLAGRLDPQDASSVKGEYVDTFSFEFPATGPAMVELQALGFDGYLRLTSPSGQVWRNDDAPGGDVSRSEIGPLLYEPGAWTADVTSAGEGEVGAYDLRVLVFPKTN